MDPSELEGHQLLEYNVRNRSYGLSFAADPRFITSHDQTKWCFNSYSDWQRCIDLLGEDAERCKYMNQKAHALCPGKLIEMWGDQVEEGDKFYGFRPNYKPVVDVVVDYTNGKKNSTFFRMIDKIETFATKATDMILKK